MATNWRPFWMLAAEIFYFFRLDTYRMCNAVGYVGDKGLHADRDAVFFGLKPNWAVLSNGKGFA